MSATPEGRWRPVQAELDGEAAPMEVLERTEVEFAAGRYAVRFGHLTADEGTFALDPAPGHFTLRGTQGPNAGRTIPCLFAFAGADLRVCYGLEGERPAAFATQAGSGLYLVTYRRL